MATFPTDTEISALDRLLDEDRAVPRDPVAERVVSWHLFRRRDQALDFARHIMLGDGGGSLTGGRTADSLGALYWVGVRVGNLDAWGHPRSIHKVGFVDPQNPKSPML